MGWRASAQGKGKEKENKFLFMPFKIAAYHQAKSVLDVRHNKGWLLVVTSRHKIKVAKAHIIKLPPPQKKNLNFWYN